MPAFAHHRAGVALAALEAYDVVETFERHVDRVAAVGPERAGETVQRRGREMLVADRQDVVAGERVLDGIGQGRVDLGGNIDPDKVGPQRPRQRAQLEPVVPHAGVRMVLQGVLHQFIAFSLSGSNRCSLVGSIASCTFSPSRARISPSTRAIMRPPATSWASPIGIDGTAFCGGAGKWR